MIWTIERIDDADFGCEERMPGEPLMSLVSLRGDDGRLVKIEAPDIWLRNQQLDEGDEWPFDIEAFDEEDEKIIRQNEWMDGYFDAVEEMEDGE